MMSEKHRLHWVTAIIELFKSLKELIVPLIVIFAANMFGRENTGSFWVDYFPLIFFALGGLFAVAGGIIKWRRFIYWFEDGELRVESGLFVKKKRYIPFERIQSVDYTEGILHRPFGLVKVKIETAGSSSALEASEADLTAVTREEAERVSAVISEAKRKRRTGVQEVPEGTEGIDAPVADHPEETAAKPVYKMGNKEIFFLSAVSGRIGLIFSGIAIFLSQFSELIPYELIYDEVVEFVKFGVFMVVAAVLALMILGWLLSVAWTYLGFYGFMVSFDGDDLFISRGLLEKKRTTVPLKRIQAVRVSVNPFQKLFGYSSVRVHSAGGGVENGSLIQLFPLIKQNRVDGLLAELFPDIDTSAELKRIPVKSRPFYYRLNFFWMVPVIGLVSYFLFPYGLLSMLIIPAVVLLGIWQHRSAGWALSNRQLTVRWRDFTLHTVYVFRKRIQSMQERQTIFQKQRNVATVTASFKSGIVASHAPIRHIEEADADLLMDWYDPGKRPDKSPEQAGSQAIGGE